MQILKENAIKEIVKCSRNPVYFIEKYVKIQHPTRGLIDFKLYDYQKDVIRAFLEEDRVIINKGRQLGLSTAVSAFIAWMVLFHNDKSILCLAKDADSAKNIIRKVKLILSKLPSWIWLTEIEINQAHYMKFTNGSWLKSVAPTESAGRSEGVSMILLDECAFIPNMDELWKAAGSTVSTGGKAFAISTPDGVGNWFHSFFTDAIEGKNGWFPFELFWWMNPEYAAGLYDSPEKPGGKSSPWFDRMTAGWTASDIAQEYLASFLDTGNTYIPSVTIALYESKKRDPIIKKGPDNKYWVWREPQPEKKYLVSADPSTGTGEDSAAVTVIDLFNFEVVAEYVGKMQPDILGEFLIQVCTEYNNALLSIENTGIGLAAVTAVRMLKYKNLAYFDKDSGKLLKEWEAEQFDLTAGFSMNPQSRPMILAKLEEVMRKGDFKHPSIRFINELKTFVTKNGKPQAKKNTHDDCLMSSAMGVWVRDFCSEFGAGNKQQENNADLWKYMIVSKTSYADQQKTMKENENRSKIQQQMESHKRIATNVPIHVEDFSWIYKM